MVNYILAAASLLGSAYIGKKKKEGYEQQSQDELETAAINRALIRQKGKVEEGKMIVYFGQSGVTMEGSPIDAIGQNAYNVALDEYVIQFGADRLAASLKATGKLAQRSELIGGVINATSTAFG